MSTKRSRHTKHSKRKNQGATSPSIGANHHNFKHHRKLIPNLTFKTVPIVEIDVMDDARHLITTSNFIDKVSEYSKRPDVIDSGGFFIMRPKSTQKHRYLIDPQKIEHWNPQKHSDKHYFINEKQQNSHNHKPYNHKHWVYDIPQLSRTVDGLPLLVGSFPQRTCDVLTPLFTEQKVSHHPNDMPGLFHQHQKAHMNHKQDTSCSQTTNNRPSRKRKRHHRSASNHDTKRRKLHHHDHPIYKTPFTLPKALSIPKRDSLFDLSAYISTSDPLTIDVCSNRSDIASVDSFPTSNSSSFNDTVFISNHHNHNHNNSDWVVLSTNNEPIELQQQAFDVLLWNKLLSKRDTKPPVTLCDMAMDKDTMMPMPSLIPSTNSPPLPAACDTVDALLPCALNGDTAPVSTTIGLEMISPPPPVDMQQLRGFAFIVNQFEAQHMQIEEFWKANEFESELVHSPYDDACAEDVPLILASHLISGGTRCYGIIGDNVTVYEERSPLDLINLPLHGPFAEFKEGGEDNEYIEGVHQPYIYLGNTSTWFAWHREDMNLYAVNHLLWGSDKLWYCIPPQSTQGVLEYVRAQYSEYCGDCNDSFSCWTPLQHKQFWFDPYILLSMGIDVYFMRQKPGDIMITPPGGLHSGMNTGPNMAESLNFMTYEMQCWKMCLSAMHFALFNPCQACLNSVWINFNQLAQRCRRSKKCKGKLKRYAPSTDLVAWFGEEIQPNICMPLTKKERRVKMKEDPISQICGEKLWVYPVRRPDAKCWYPAIWIDACYSWDSAVFEMLYTFKYLDSGTIKGRNEPEMFGVKDVLWDKGLLIWDWNRAQRFKPMTPNDKACIAKKYSYPRRQGNMLINYTNVVNKEYKNLYYKKCVYYQSFPQEIPYRDAHKKKSNTFRSHAQMVKDIDEQHLYFTQPLTSTDSNEDDS
eukprot:319277_1